MDIVHHAAVGGIGYCALAANQQELAGLAFVAGSVFPDLDVAFMALGKRGFLKFHQTITHSLILAPVFAMAFIAYPLCIPVGFMWPVFFAALAGIWIHSMLDYTNTFGITLLWPISRRRFCLDAVFFIDATTWFLTVACYLAILVFHWQQAVIAYACLFIAYSTFKYLLHRRVIRSTNALCAIPSAIHPFQFFVARRTNEGVLTFLINGITSKCSSESIHKSPDKDHLELINKSQLYNDMLGFTRCLFITKVEESTKQTTIILHDLGVRNFGGMCGRTTLTFDSEGELLNETANI